MPITKEQAAVAARILASLTQGGNEDDDEIEEIEELVKEAKEREAQIILQRGLKESVEYLVSQYAGDALAERESELLDQVEGYLPSGAVIECNAKVQEDGRDKRCGRRELKDKAVLVGQSWHCSRCSKSGAS